MQLIAIHLITLHNILEYMQISIIQTEAADFAKINICVILKTFGHDLTLPFKSLGSLRNFPQNTSLNINSEEATLGCWPPRQSSSIQCLCYFAHLNLLFLLANLRYGFFFATLPRRQAFRSCLFTVDVETGDLRVLFNEAKDL